MTNIESDELLRQVVGELGQLRKLLDERLPQPAKVDTTPVASGVRQAVVTGEDSTPPPVTPSAVRKTATKRR